MKRSNEIAQEAEQDHLVRKRLTTKQRDPNMKRSNEIAQKAEQDHLVKKRITTKQREN